MNWKWDGKECVIMSRCIDELGQVQPSHEQVAKVFNVPPDYYHDHGVPGSDNTIVPWRVGAMGASTMRLPKASVRSGVARAGKCDGAQSPTYGLGKTPTAEEIRAWDIAISPDGKELPQGSGSAKEGATIYAQKCAACHGRNGSKGALRS